MRFIKDQLHAKVKVGFFNIIGIFCAAVPSPSEITDDITSLDIAALLKCFVVRVIFPEMGIVIIPLFVKAADAKAPAAVLIPANGFHIAGFDSNYRCSDLPHQVMTKMLAFEAIAAGDSEVVKIMVRKISGNRRKSF